MSVSLSKIKPVLLFLAATTFIFTVNSSSIAKNNNDGEGKIGLVRNIALSHGYRVTDSYQGASDVLAVNISDYHCNYPTQKKHKDFIEEILNTPSFKIGFIGIEGANGVIDTTFAHAFPDKNIRDKMAVQFLKDGTISGAEYFSITSGKPALIYGIDSTALYKKNYELFYRLQTGLKQEKETVKNIINYIGSTALFLLKNNAVSENDGIAFIDQYYLFIKNELSYVDFAKILIGKANSCGIPISGYKTISALDKVSKLQTKINDAKLDSETQQFMSLLKPEIAVNVLKSINDMNAKLSLGIIVPESFYGYLFYECGSKLSGNFSELNKMRDITRLSSSIDEKSLNAEIFQLLKEIPIGLNIDNADRDYLFDLIYISQVIIDMIDLTASRYEYDFYLSWKPLLDLTSILNKLSVLLKTTQPFEFSAKDLNTSSLLISLAESFYIEASKRDKAMALNTLIANSKISGNTIVSITGGFHSVGMAAFFKERKISYISLSPVLSSNRLDSNYKEIMGGLPEFDNLLFSSISPVNKLMPPSNFGNILNTTRDAVMAAKWVLFANVLSASNIVNGEKIPAARLEEMFKTQQDLWISNLKKELPEKYKLYLQTGLISLDFINQTIAEFEQALSAVSFDFDHYELFEKSLSFPIILKGNPDKKLVVNIQPDSDAFLDFDGFFDAAANMEVPGIKIRVFDYDDFIKIYKNDEIQQKAGIELTLAEKQKLAVLADVFDITAVQKFLSENTAKYIKNTLKKTPSYNELKQTTATCGIDNCEIMFLWDSLGFFNISNALYQMNPDDLNNNNGVFEYIQTLINQRVLQNEKRGKIPDFIINEANELDLSEWFGSDVKRYYNYDRWADVVSTNEIFIKASNIKGEVLGLVSARYDHKNNIMVIDLLETSADSRMAGIGKALVKAVVMESIEAGGKGKIILFPEYETGSEIFYKSLGFKQDPFNSKYLLLTEKNAKKLIGVTETGKQKKSVLVIDQSSIANFSKIPLVKTIERMSTLLTKYNSLTNDDKLFILAQLIRFDEITQSSAEKILNKLVADEQYFEDKLTNLYDAMVNKWMQEQEGVYEKEDLELYDAARPSIITGVPAVTTNISYTVLIGEISDYLSVLDSMNNLKSKYGGFSRSAFNKTLAEKPSAVNLAKKQLESYGFFLNIQILNKDDPRVKNKTATLIDNIIYLNESALVADFWFYLPHEVSHLLKDESYARKYDAENIRHLKALAVTFLDTAKETANSGRADTFAMIGANLMYQALSYELDIVTAKLQLTSAGIEFLKSNNLPIFKDSDRKYLEAIAKSSAGLIQALPLSSLKDKLRSIGNDKGLNETQFNYRANNIIVRNLIEFSLNRTRYAPSKIDKDISAWIETQLNRGFWDIGKAKIPKSIEPYVVKSSKRIGAADIKDIQKTIFRLLKQMPAGKEKTNMQRDLVKWLTELIRENIKPENSVAELKNVMEQRVANCLGFTKLFNAVAYKFGFDSGMAIIEYDYNGKIELHAVNIVKYSDGSFELLQIAQAPQNAKIKNILVRIKDKDKWAQKLVSAEEFNKLASNNIDGVTQNSIDAYTYSTRASIAYDKGDITGALNYMSKAYELDPDNIYIAFNLAEIIYYDWMATTKKLGITPSDEDSLNKISELFYQFQLYKLGFEAFNYFLRELKENEHPILEVGIIDKIGGGGNAYFSPYAKPAKPSDVKPFEPSKQDIEPPDTAKPTQKPELTRQQPDQSQLTRNLINDRLTVTTTPTASTPASRASAIEAYRVNSMVGDGVSFNSARRLIHVGQQIESLIQQRRFQQAQEMITGLDVNFAQQVMLQFPWIMAYMIEVNPKWWKGDSIAELARKAVITESIRELVRKQLTTVTAVTPVLERDNMKQKQTPNPLWELMDSNKIIQALDRVHNRGAVNDDQYRAVYDMIIQRQNTPLAGLPQTLKWNLFGKMDETPFDNGLTIQGEYIISEIFVSAPAPSDFSLYASYIRDLIREHPKEMFYLLTKHPDNTLIFKIEEQIGARVYDHLSVPLGAFTVVAKEVFSAYSDTELYGAIRHNLDDNLSVMLESVFTTNSSRNTLRDFIDNVYSFGLLSQPQRDTVDYLRKYYVEGDEQTDNFKQAIEILQTTIHGNAILTEKLIDIAASLKERDAGNLFFAFLSMKHQLVNPIQNIDVFNQLKPVNRFTPQLNLSVKALDEAA